MHPLVDILTQANLAPIRYMLEKHITPATAWSLACLAKGSSIRISWDKAFLSACCEQTEHLLSQLMPAQIMPKYKRTALFYDAFLGGPKYAVLAYLWDKLILAEEKYEFKKIFTLSLKTLRGSMHFDSTMNTARFFWDCIIASVPSVYHYGNELNIRNIFVYCIRSKGDDSACSAIFWLRTTFSNHLRNMEYMIPSIAELYETAIDCQADVIVKELFDALPLTNEFRRAETSNYLWHSCIISIWQGGIENGTNTLHLLQHMYSKHGSPFVDDFWNFLFWRLVLCKANSDIFEFLQTISANLRIADSSEKQAFLHMLLSSFRFGHPLERHLLFYFSDKVVQFMDEDALAIFANNFDAIKMATVRQFVNDCNSRHYL